MNAGAAARAGRLSVATLAGTVWTLRAWDIGEPAGPESGVSLAVDAGRITGSSGCNRYFAVVEGGAIPAAMRIGPVGGTRTFGIVVGRLAISYARAGGSGGTMLFDSVAE